MILLLALALSAQEPAPPEIGATVRSEAYDFEIQVPSTWKRAPAAAPTFFRIEAPAGGIAEGTAWLLHGESNHPATLAFLVAEFRRRAEGQYPGFEKISEREDARAAGCPAYVCVFAAKPKGRDMVFIHAIVQRQLQEYFVLDGVAARGEKDRIEAIHSRMLASLKFGLPMPRERAETLARTARLLKASGVRAELLGTCWHQILVGKQKLGWQRTLLREGKVEGGPGYEFEMEMELADSEGGRHHEISRGSFTPDGAVQTVDFRKSVQDPRKAAIEVKESASLVRGTYKAVREFLDAKVEKTIAAPEGTVLGDIADTMRRRLIIAGPGTYALRVLLPFRDLAATEEWEVAAATRIRTDVGERELVTAFVKPERQEMWEYLYEPGGALYQRKAPRNPFLLRRCTEEEAKKR
jgi:hypothetical protein